MDSVVSTPGWRSEKEPHMSVSPETAIRLQGVTKSYGAVLAVQGIDLEIRRGETVALLGPTGAGKTTTISMLLGLLLPTSGTVEVFGRTPAQAGIRCLVYNDAGALPAPIEALLTWVVREGVTNVMRHSRTKQHVIALTCQSGEICLTVTDDGQGDSHQMSSAALQSGQPGNGLRGLRGRAAALGGRCEAGSVGKHGFRLAAVLPLEGKRRQVTPPAEQARGAVG